MMGESLGVGFGVPGLGFRVQGLGELDEHSFPAPPIPPSQYGLKNNF